MEYTLCYSSTESVALKLGGGFRCLRCGTIFGKADILAKHQQKCTASKRLSDVISPSRQTPSSPPASADTVENVFEVSFVVSLSIITLSAYKLAATFL